RRYVDPARLLLARSYYANGNFKGAVTQLKLIGRGSNDLSESLSELAWAFLMDERYNEAIGASISLQAGGLRHTFAPEAPMVMSMALNELCQYPDAVRAIQVFRRNYESPHRWLTEWETHPKDLYPLAAQFLNKGKEVPERVASEWVRSPLFISHQDEI